MCHIKVFTEEYSKVHSGSRGNAHSIVSQQKYIKNFHAARYSRILASIIIPGLRQERVRVMNFPVASHSLELARIKYASLQHRQASGSFATVFDFFATRHSSRLWILFANCEPVPVVIAPRGRGKRKDGGGSQYGTPYIQLGPDVNRDRGLDKGQGFEI